MVVLLVFFPSSFDARAYHPILQHAQPSTMADATKKEDDVVVSQDVVQQDDLERTPPTEEDWKTLREVPGTIPWAAFLVIVIEFCERFTYYGISGPFQNYVQFPDPGECKRSYILGY